MACAFCGGEPCHRPNQWNARLGRYGCAWQFFECVTCHQEIDKATTQWCGVGHPMFEAEECMPCHTRRTGETFGDVVRSLVKKIATDG